MTIGDSSRVYMLNYSGVIARWLPKDPATIRKYHHDLLNDVNENELPITNYVHLAVLDKTIAAAPSFVYTSPLVSVVPMYAVLVPFCNTGAGYRAFTNPKVNAMIHKIFDVWARFLVSPASRNVLVTAGNGWFSPDAGKDTFWLKDMSYSLERVLNYDPHASRLVNRTNFWQAILSSLDYPRWHSPVDGRVVKVYVVPGTYYAVRTDDVHDNADAITCSMAFQSAICTRAFIDIESNNPNIG
ncbi:hypothetical protein OG21DRAFT_1487140 [Imleria badia]|nr:hypothetical protein OG21DRAFT_1487140 [Imleria badia]